jgi:hypothetical protein
MGTSSLLSSLSTTRLVAQERLEVPLEGDITLPVVHMVKGTSR